MKKLCSTTDELCSFHANFGVFSLKRAGGRKQILDSNKYKYMEQLEWDESGLVEVVLNYDKPRD